MPPKTTKPPLTHFLAIPLATPASTPHLSASFARFVSEASIHDGSQKAPETASNRVAPDDPLDLLISKPTASTSRAPTTTSYSAASTSAGLSDNGSQDLHVVPSRAFRPVTTLHLTVGTMSLRTPERIAEATSFLRSLNLPDLLQDASESQIQLSLNPSEPSDHVQFPAQNPESLECNQRQAESVQSLPNQAGGSSSKCEPAPGLVHSPGPRDSSALAPLSVTLKGLHAMQALRSTSILYAHPEDHTNRLRPFAESLVARFEGQGLLVREDRALKLHATIINMVYASEQGRGKKRSGFKRKTKVKGIGKQDEGRVKEGEGEDEGKEYWTKARGGNEKGPATVDIEEDVEYELIDLTDHSDQTRAGGDSKEGGRNKPGRGKLDARALVERWKDEIWAEIRVERVAICEMGAKVGEDGVVRYKEIAGIDMP